MVKYKIQNAACFVLSLLLGFSIVFTLFGAVTVALLRSESFVEGEMAAYREEMLFQVNDRLAVRAANTNIPAEAFTSALTEDNSSAVFQTISNNIVHGYVTDFSDDEGLYNTFANEITNYCSARGIEITSEEVVGNAALAVDTVNDVLGSVDTAGIRIFKSVQSQRPMYLITFAAVLAIVCAVILDLINYGRHRKYSYIGMGIVIAGYLLTFGAFFAKYKNYAALYQFCGFEYYNLTIADCINKILLWSVFIGLVVLAAGVIILAVNYNYFKKKNDKMQESRQINEKLRNEYLEDYAASQAQNEDNGGQNDSPMQLE